MNDDPSDREPIVSDGPYAVIDAMDGDPAAYRLVTTDDGIADADEHRSGVPIDETTIDDLAATVSRLRGMTTDVEGSPDQVELSCHDCGTTWTYTGSDEHASCPNCDTEVPLEGIGP